MSGAEQQLSILVVDDEQPVRDILYRYLTKQGHHVLTTRNGKEALLMSSHGFDAIILDIHMPDMNGLEVLHHLKTKYPDSAVIMLTGVADPESVIEAAATKMGAVRFLKKPCELVDVESAILETIEQRKAVGQ